VDRGLSGVTLERVVLLGIMGSGKSTVGPLLAARLGWSFHDLDAEIEARTGRSVERIFAEQGEAAFRRLESEAGRDLLERDRLVLSVGGGWPCHGDPMTKLPPGTSTVWLRAGVDEILRRLDATQLHARPLLHGDAPDALRRLLAERERHYERAEHHVVTAGRTPLEIAQDIERRLRRGEAAAPV
jgi:shikimate kinase